MIPFEKCESHPGRPLRDHLVSVAGLMEQQARAWQSGVPQCFARLARLVGLLHDTGKATSFFQTERLRGLESRPDELGNHAHFSAVVTLPILRSACSAWGQGEAEADLLFAVSLMTILRHHGPLKDFCDYIITFYGRLKHDKGEVFARQFDSIDVAGLESFLSAEFAAMALAPPSISMPPRNELRWMHKFARSLAKNRSLSDYFTAELLFSLLVWADKIDAATSGHVPSRHTFAFPPELVDDFKSTKFGASSSTETQLREEVYREVEQTLFDEINSNQRLFTLTAPTGSGKTLAVLNAAIKLRQKIACANGTPRIIYCLPFTSIIDQNFDVIGEVFQTSGVSTTSDILIKHHHLVGPEYTDREQRDYAYDVGQLLVESWDSEIVVTTFIQLLESLIGNRNSMLRKAARVPGSIVLLDEVQAIPREYWEVVRDTLEQFACRFDTRFILLTATKPLIFEPNEATELLPSHRRIFAAFDRYDIHIRCREATSLEQFQSEYAKMIRDNPQSRHLAVMNTVESSIELFKNLRSRRTNDFGSFRKQQLVYLSTNVTPRDRRERIRKIQSSDDPMVIVATQVIEAGVDISVDVLHRDFAPFDSIVQSAGRCNRSNDRPVRGQVYLWNLQPDEEGRRPYSHIYKSLLRDITANVVLEWSDDVIPEQMILALGQHYFEQAKRRLAEAEIQAHMRCLDFAKVANAFQLIQECPKQSYFVQQSSDRKSFAIWDKFVSLSDTDDPLQRKAAFSEIKPDFFDRVIHIRLPYGEQPETEILLLTDDEAMGDYYDQDVGFQGNGCAIF